MSIPALFPETSDTFVKTKFTHEEEAYLDQFIPSWQAKFYGVADQKTSLKGSKKLWVMQKPYTEFTAKFFGTSALQPQEDILQDKMYRWFLNRTGDANGNKPRSFHKTLSVTAHEMKKPRSTNGFEVFSEDRKEEIVQLSRTKTNRSLSNDNLASYKESCKELWDALSDHAKDEYNLKALEKNDLVKKGPTERDIEINQSHIVEHTMKALSSLTGHHWTGHGNAVFFVMGAHRRKDGRLKTFFGSVQDDDEFARRGFQRACPEFKQDFMEPFKAWAEKAVPGESQTLYQPYGVSDKLPARVLSSAEETLAISTEKVDLVNAFALGALSDGFPVIGELDLEDISPKDAKDLLLRFIVAAWTNEAPGLPIPWKSLASSNRHQILRDALPFEQFDCLDPSSAHAADIYSILNTIISEQNKGCRPLQFVLPTTNSPANDHSSGSDCVQNVRFDFSPPRPRGGKLLALSETPTRYGHSFLSDSEGDEGKRSDGDNDEGSWQPIRYGEEDQQVTKRKRCEKPSEDVGAKTGQASKKKRSIGGNTSTGSRRVSMPQRCKKRSGDHKQTSKEISKLKQKARVAAEKVVDGDSGNNTPQRKNGTTLPPRAQSARLRDSKYRNANVTVRIRN